MADLTTDIQYGCREFYIPEPSLIREWAQLTYAEIVEGSAAKIAAADTDGPLELTIRIVDEEEGAQLNKKYRKKNGATNVLSFPFEGPNASPQSILGDIVICAPVVAREAQVSGTSAQDHWAHLVVHGILHLCGFNHKTHKQAEIMESLEVNILAKLGFHDPYETLDG